MTQPAVRIVDRGPQRTLGRGLLAVGTLAVTVLCALLVPGAAYANTGPVEIVNVFSSRPSLRADVMWASHQDGQGVFLWVNNKSFSQLFDLINMGGGYFQIRAKHSAKCLMLARGRGVGNGTRIVQYPCTPPTYKSAQWRFVPIHPPCADNALCVNRGWKIIQNRYRPDLCIDADNPAGKKPPQQAALQLWACISRTTAWNAENQIWKIWDPFKGEIIFEPR